ncbi:MAG: hypothetical protein JW940_24240 [Polyangiaceae bacterium]|nr:hypothetical protein [Polyangiaceae bacterium]
MTVTGSRVDSGAAPEAGRSPFLQPTGGLSGLDEAVASMDDDATIGPGDLDPEKALSAELEHLERWARAIVWGGRFEGLRSALLRSLALLGSGAAAALGLTGRQELVVPLCALAALAIAVHAASPRVTALGVHCRALCDIRDLEDLLKIRWHTVRLVCSHVDSQKRLDAALQLMALLDEHRKEIGRSLGSAEPTVQIPR